jgi:hypothetical protein
MAELIEYVAKFRLLIIVYNIHSKCKESCIRGAEKCKSE